LLLLLVPVYLAVTPPSPPPPLAPAEAARIDSAITEKKAELEKLSHRVYDGKPADFSLVLREAEINRLLETDARLQRAMRKESVNRAWVSIADGKITARALRDGTPSSITVTVVPTIGPDHRLQLDIEGVGIGQLGVPAVSAIKHAAQKAIAMLTDKSMIPAADFESVQAENGAITLKGTAK
jgi:hypothetical protein